MFLSAEVSHTGVLPHRIAEIASASSAQIYQWAATKTYPVTVPLRPCHRASQSSLFLGYCARAIVPVTKPSRLCHRACADVLVPKTLRRSHCACATVPVPSCLCLSHCASACVFLLKCQIQNAQFQCTSQNYRVGGNCDAKSTETKSTLAGRLLFDPSVWAFPAPPPDRPSMEM